MKVVPLRAGGDTQGTADISENLVVTASKGAATGAGQTQQAAGELAHMATGLTQLVERFRNVSQDSLSDARS